ncbi:DUF2630 family protein [Nocardia higoensis]|uniref:DUF2630 family protein n=1 Tax=Nocardia higoensis TaxID=228599 RepID=UPI0002DF6F60|nr:DUF2630 family protein [Nocardia higoensis]
MSDQDLLARIRQLVDDEHQLRAKAVAGKVDPVDERKRLAEIEVMLDQCWDLLRQRRARLDSGGSPDEAQLNPPRQVEGYLQ